MLCFGSELLGFLLTEGFHGLLDLLGRLIEPGGGFLLCLFGCLLVAGGHLLLGLVRLLTGLVQRLGSHGCRVRSQLSRFGGEPTDLLLGRRVGLAGRGLLCGLGRGGLRCLLGIFERLASLGTSGIGLIGISTERFLRRFGSRGLRFLQRLTDLTVRLLGQRRRLFADLLLGGRGLGRRIGLPLGQGLSGLIGLRLLG